MPEQEVLERLRRLKAAGLIRRIGATFHPDRLGYVSTLVGMQVPGEHVECVAAFVGRFPEVTHSYERDGDWNLWFTVVAPSAQRLTAVLDAVREAAPGCRLVSLPAKRRYKVRVEFDLVRLNDGSLADR
jgi:DNA-binding Lrp family transcriptional regulator